MSLSEFVFCDRWCKGCAAEKEQIRTPLGYVCEECDTLNDGWHPAEKSDVVQQEYQEGLEKIKQDINRRKVFPQLPHTNRQYLTAVSSRSTKLTIFRRSKHTAL